MTTTPQPAEGIEGLQRAVREVIDRHDEERTIR